MYLLREFHARQTYIRERGNGEGPGERETERETDWGGREGQGERLRGKKAERWQKLLSNALSGIGRRTHMCVYIFMHT